MLKLGIGNGSLLKPVTECLGKIGVVVDTETRRAWQEANHELVSRVFVCRPQHVVTYLERGKIDGAVIGQDMLAEYGDYGIERASRGYCNDWRIFFSFPFTKSSFNNLGRVVLFTSEAHIKGKQKLQHDVIRVLSEYPRLTRWFLNENGAHRAGSIPHYPHCMFNMEERVTFSTGGTETPVSEGVYDYGVGITDSGDTLKANKVREIACIMEAPVVLVTTTYVLQQHRGLDRKIIELGKLFSGVLAEKRRKK